MQIPFPEAALDRIRGQRALDVVDAVSFSSAIPGVLHHETSDPSMVSILDTMLEENDVAAPATPATSPSTASTRSGPAPPLAGPHHPGDTGDLGAPATHVVGGRSDVSDPDAEN